MSSGTYLGRAASLALLCMSGALAQPPLIYYRGIVNAASYMPAGIPAGAIAQGSIFTIFGARLGPAQPVTANTYPLQTTLGGVSMNVIQGNTTVSVIPIYVSSGQINAIMPSNAPLGVASLQVIANNSPSNLAPIRIASSAFGIFTALGTGSGPGILQNFISATNQPINSATVTAQLGQAIVMWGTGLGPVGFLDTEPPTAGNLPVKVEVFVGGISAPVEYSGRTPCCAGTDQIVFNVPANAPTGCWVPVYVRTGGTTISNFVTMAIGPNANSCTTDVFPQITSVFVNGGSVGAAGPVRTTTRHDIGTYTGVEVTSDYHARFATSPKPGQFPFNPAVAFPPAGTCTVYTLQGDMLGGDLLPSLFPATPPLDFGPALSLTGPNGMKSLIATFTGGSAGYLGGAISNGILPSTLYLDPGSYTIQGFGGANVGAFSTAFTIPQPTTWIGRDQLIYVNRSQPLNLAWSGGDSGQVNVILGFGEDLPLNSSAAFACLAPPGASSFSVPTDILSNLPATRANPLHSKDVIYLLSVPGGSIKNLNATGLDYGISGFALITGKSVVLQ